MGQQLLLGLKTKAAYNAVDFFVSQSNQEAHLWIQNWQQWPSHAFLLHGPEGSGKTHLAHVWQEYTHADFLSPDDLSSSTLLEHCEKNLFFVLEDLQAPLTSAQEKGLFHLYNAIKEKKGKLLITSLKPSEAWEIELPDLRSRLNSIPKAPISPPDDQMRTALVLKLFSDQQIQLNGQQLDQILQKAPPTFKGTQAFVRNLCDLSLSHKKKITNTLITQTEKALAA